jgi:phosphatidylserine/phosphatidylglycerophosphate/cardiolipin synthase-like enzyme
MTDQPDRPPTITLAEPNIQLLGLADAQNQLKSDIQNSHVIYVWAYLIEANFFSTLFAAHLSHARVYMIVDHRQRYVCAGLQDTFERFTARSWSYNRTMHEKSFIFPELNTVWTGSHNLTRGSFTLSNNRSARIESDQLTKALADAWHRDWTLAKTIPRLKTL